MRWSLLWISAALACAQGTNPKPTAAEYDVHGQAGSLDIGAEYMVHSFSAGEQMYLAENYLVVEVAIYPLMKDDPVQIDLKDFRLHLNRKTTLQADQPAQAAASLTNRPWQIRQTRGLSGGIGVGPMGVPIGRQPGGPVQTAPTPPRAPQADPRGDGPREVAHPDEILVQTALPEGTLRGKVSGFVYFPYQGKTSSIKALELEYKGAILKLK